MTEETKSILKTDWLSPTARWVVGGLLTGISIICGLLVWQTVDAHDKTSQPHMIMMSNHDNKEDSHLALQRKLVQEVAATVISANAALNQLQTKEIIEALKKK